MDGMQDPGNVGTLIRTAVACGVSEVMLVQGCDPWSPKALRSGMGATFKAPLVSEAGSWEGAYRHQRKYPILPPPFFPYLNRPTNPPPHTPSQKHKTHTQRPRRPSRRGTAGQQGGRQRCSSWRQTVGRGWMTTMPLTGRVRVLVVGRVDVDVDVNGWTGRYVS